ncbi:N-formylglutamate deformylase [Alisedimentitalea sp. MJ-SS2]|uniref:N-formylglutamate deformylase n=1 Tax=Aliisedimentitalea sp. MJ-SS2 TaxID=3049795 RepID=UPI002907602D|nr:N-formylglutamate deformylase [Alisedimentitalea sp. MJ-SS2]MDU8925848.1 N-formylglutamate deformylase [Alisedimentitalea sp. MJ-SS2]
MIEVTRGTSPLILGLPHTGTYVPPEIMANFNDNGHALADTDWHIDRLYDGLVENITTIRTPVHRYVIDANRDPAGVSLYPDQNTTTLCPLTDFDGNPIYLSGREPDEVEITRRRDQFHTPYHDAIRAELARVKSLYGIAILYDCHSIRSHIPFLFKGTLPDFNIGTDLGRSCHARIEQAVANVCAGATGFTSVYNGRFKGGWTTRHHGVPVNGVHAIQMELAQSTYMQESPPWTYDDTRATALRAHLKTILETLIRWRPT